MSSTSAAEQELLRWLQDHDSLPREVSPHLSTYDPAEAAAAQTLKHLRSYAKTRQVAVATAQALDEVGC